MDISEHFNVEELSDVVLHVATTKVGKKRSASAAVPARSYFLSKAVISQANFFRALILWWTPARKGAQAAQGDGAPGRMELQHSVAADELEAFELLLRLMYGSAALPVAAASDAMLLVKAYVAANMYCIPRCIEVLAAALCSLSAEGLDLDLVKALYSLPEGHAHLAPLMAKCQQRLVQLFGDVPSVITSDQLRQQFCSLPYAAVLAWLKADDLKVHSENCVVFLLSTWVASRKHAVCHAAQLEELACHVRVLHLSTLYLQCVLPSLAWFSSQVEHLPFLVLERLSGETSGEGWEGPPAWQAGPRKRSGLPSLTLDWEISGAQLQQLYDDEDVHSEPLYVNGVYSELSVELQAVAAEQQPEKCTLGLYLGLREELMGAVLDDASVYILVKGMLMVKVPATGNWEAACLVDGFTDSSLGCDMLDCSISTQEAVASFLVGGKLSVRATGIRFS